MPTRVADTIKQQNDLKTFPVAYSEDIWIDKNKGEGEKDYADLQELYNEGALGGSGLPEPESKNKILVSVENTEGNTEWKQTTLNTVVNETEPTVPSLEFIKLNTYSLGIPEEDLVEGQDLNELTTRNRKYKTTGAVASTLLHCPVTTTGFRLTVYSMSVTSYVTQIIETADDRYIRYWNKSKNKWYDWKKFLTDADEVGDVPFKGTHDEWDALTDEEKAQYETVIFTDDYGEGVIDDTKISGNSTWSSEKINNNLGEKVDKNNAVVKALKIEATNGTAQVIPWIDGTHYRSIDGNNGNDYTDIITKDGTAHLVKVKNGGAIKDEELATMDKVVKNEVTTTTFINSNNKVYKQGKMCTATIMSLLLNTTYNTGEVLGVIGNPAFFPKDGIRGLVVQLNSGQASEIRINPDGTISVGQATSLTAGYWVGNFSWVTN